MTVPAFIFARGGSKGLPRKNIRMLAGKPLIARAIDRARQSRRVSRVIVSTDDPEIAEVAAVAGAEVPFLRPAELAQDGSPEWLAWRHALAWMEAESGLPDLFVTIPTTAPLGLGSDIDAAITRLETGHFDIVISVAAAHRNPSFNMVTLDEGGAARLVIPPARSIAGRQSAPACWDVTTVVYAARPSFVLSSAGIFDGRVGAIEIPVERAIDIDTPHDFDIAEFLFRRQNPES